MRRLAKFAHTARLPRRTVRLRLTLLYGSLFVVSGAALLGTTYLLVRHASSDAVHVTSTQVAPPRGGNGPAVAPSPRRCRPRSSGSKRRLTASGQSSFISSWCNRGSP